MTEQDVHTEQAAGRRGGFRAVRIPFVAWGVSLIIHLLVLFFVANLVWPGRMGAGTEGQEYEVGIAVGPGTEAVDTEIGAVGSSHVLPAETVEEMAFESNVTADIELQSIQSDFQAAELPAEIVPIESIAMGQGVTGQGLWADTQIAGGGQGRGGASFFGLEAKGGKFVYVVDRSGSMSGQPLLAAKAELTRSIMSLGDRVEFFVFFYNTDPMPMPGGDLVKASAGNVTDALNWIEGVAASGGTDPQSTMKQALSLKPDAIWLLSDGQFDAQAAKVIANENPGSRVMIHTIAFFNRDGEAVLKQIANENGGQYRFVQQP